METKTSIVKKLIGAAGFAFFAFGFAHSTSAASLYLSPGTGQNPAGQSFAVGVYVSSADQAMNAAQGAISFPSDKLDVISVSTANSIINLWVQQPSFSNRDGVVNFQGVVVNPGFQGARGRIITITFRAKSPGVANVAFTSGSVLANDGNGTNILTALEPGNYTVAPAPAPAPPPPAPTADNLPPPPFTITEVFQGANDPTDPRPLFTWNAIDSSSGISKYSVKIGHGDWFDAATIKVATSAPNLYQLPLQAPSDNILLTVDAYDRAGNMAEATTTFSIAAMPAPQITNYSHEILAPSQLFKAEGTAPKGALVNIYLQKPGGGNVFAFSSKADQNGMWKISENVSPGSGLWLVKAQAVDERGAISAESAGLPVNFGDRFTRIIGFLVGWGGVILAVILLLAIIAASLYAIYHRFVFWRLKARKELLKMRKELRDDLKRIDEELQDAEPGKNVDLSPGTLHRRQQSIRKEIAHIEKDLKDDIKSINDIEKE